jgi:hypothetical protein
VSSLQASTPTTASTNAFAVFDLGASCTVSNRMGDCYVQECTNARNYVSDGTVTISAGDASAPITLTPGANQQYTPFTMMAVLFQAGQTVSVSTSGGTAPAYTASAAMPSRITISAPAKPAGALSIDRAQDFTVAWTGGAVGDVELLASSTASPNKYVICEVLQSAGTGTIPGALLSMMPSGAGAISVDGWSRTTKVEADWGLYFSLFGNSLWPDGSLATISATFQ